MIVREPPGMKVWFEHHRNSEEGTHGYTISPRGGRTIARLFLAEQDMKKEEPVAIGVALCSEHDNYNKRIGRAISLGRALTDWKRERA